MTLTTTVTLSGPFGSLTFQDDPAFADPWVKLTDLTNWWSSPPVSTDETDIPNADGTFVGLAYRRGKKTAITGVVTSASELGAKTYWQQLAALSPTGELLTLTVADGLGVRTQQVKLDSAPQVIPFAANRANFQIPLVAFDPRKYGPAVQTVVAPFTQTGGLTFPLFGSAGSAGYLSFGAFQAAPAALADNTAGSAPTWVVMTITGGIDASGFTITSTAGDLLTYTGPVPDGAQLVLSPYAGGRATLNGIDVTTNLVASSWIPVPPGTGISYSLYPAGVSDSGASLSVSCSPAWW